MINNDNKNIINNIAKNILGDDDAATMCVDNISNSMPSAANAYYAMKAVRHLAFETYMHGQTHSEAATHITGILDELATAIPVIKSDSFMTQTSEENVIALELTATMESFVCTLSRRERLVFMQRYYFAEAVSDIAQLYHLSEQAVNDILHNCLNRLKELFTDRKYRLKKETLFISLTDMSDELISEAINDTTENGNNSSARNAKKIKHIGIAVGIVAFICIAVSIAVSIFTDNDEFDINVVLAPLVHDDYVDTTVLMELRADYTLDVANIITKPLGAHLLEYIAIDLNDNNILKVCTGEVITEWSSDNPSTYYKLLGHDDKIYIIRLNNGEYTLWKYDQLLPSTEDGIGYYPYSEILVGLYGIDSATDITKLVITQTVNTSFSNDYYIEYSYNGSEITNTIENEETIAFVYSILALMTCYGPYHSDLFSAPDDIATNDTYVTYRLGIVTNAGETINTLYFSNMFNRFYEYNNYTAYNALSDDASEVMRNLLYNDNILLEEVDAIFDPYEHMYGISGSDFSRDETWDVTLSVSNIKTTGLTLKITRTDNSLSMVTIGDDFIVEAETEEGWAPLDYLNDNFILSDVAQIIPTVGGASIDIDWQWIYGTLPPGKYRLVKTISGGDMLSSSSLPIIEDRTYYVEFEISSSLYETD